MQKISDLFGNLKKPEVARKPRSERAALLQFFMEKLNRSRIADGFKPLKPSFLAFSLSHVNISDLYYLRSVCTDAENTGDRFDTTFWTKIKLHTKPGKRKFPKTQARSG